MTLSAKTAKTILLMALLVRFLSQLVWEMYTTINLSLEEFMFGLILATFVWLKFETLKFLTCLLAASVFCACVQGASNNFEIPRYTVIALKALVLVAISCINAYFWIFIDCQFIYNGTPEEGACFQNLFSFPDPRRWFSF